MTNTAQLDMDIQRLRDNAVKMNPDVKTRLVEALRSGKYRQSQGYLQFKSTQDGYRKPGFCCLGVVSELAKNDPTTQVDSRLHPCGDSMEYFSTRQGDEYAFTKSTAFLIDEVREWSGIDEKVSGALMAINDDGGSFELIADLVEEYL